MKALKTGLMMIGVALAALNGQAATNFWNGGSGSWDDPTKWSFGTVPAAGEHAAILASTSSVLLPASTADLASFTLTQTLTFTNWNSVLTATNIQIKTGATVTLPVAFTDTVPSNNIYFAGGDFTLESGATIQADNRGYSGGIVNVQQSGYGPGAGAGSKGGGHGGQGGNSGGVTNGLIHMPLNPGSGGGLENATQGAPAGAGGGAVRIDVTGHAILNGTIRANGQSATGGYGWNGGGSGGSIFITCETFAASGGSLLANGGNGASLNVGGGGGRIALVFDTTAQAALAKPLLHLSANRGGATGSYPGGMGTVYLSGDAALPETSASFNGFFYNVDSWTASQVALTNGWVRFMEPDFALTVTNDLRVVGTTARLDLYAPAVDVGGNLVVDNGQLHQFQTDNYAVITTAIGGNLVLTNAARYHVYAGVTNALTPEYGALLDIAGEMTLAGTAIFYPYSMNTNGGSVKVTAASVDVGSGSSINANGLGYLGRAGTGYGPGGGNFKGGGGYGGLGGGASAPWGQTYGVSNAPAMPGSAGGSQGSGGSKGGNGGGLIWIESDSSINIGGSLTANGGATGGFGGDAGGSGGGIFLTAQTFSGSGTMTANGSSGGNADGAGGGGGRIALRFGMTDGYLGTPTVNGGGSAGSGPSGAVGTIVRQLDGDAYLLVVQGDPAEYGTPTPYFYGQSGVAENAWVTNSVASPANEAGGQRWACIGFTVSNTTSVVASGTSTQAVFQMTENLWQVWHWTNEYYLAATANVNGSLQVDKTGWYTNGTAVSLTAVPDSGHHFLQWSGSGVPFANRYDVTLTLTMDQTRTVQANFASDTPAARTWSGTGNWFESGNWSPAGVPSAADDLTVLSGTLIIDDAASANHFSVTNATVEFRNWHTRLEASGDVHVRNAGILTLPSAGFADGEMSNRVHVIAHNFTLHAGGSINGAARGYRGVTRALDPSRAAGYGPGAGPQAKGAGHGAQGGNSGGPAYGDEEAPIYPGSSGGVENTLANLLGASGAGGGAVLLEVANLLTLNGAISANGGNYSGWSGNSGGSGGSIYLTCRRLEGSTGSLSATGGTGGGGGGGGAGGRIAVVFSRDDTDGPIESGASLAGGIVLGDDPAPARFGGTGSLHWFERPPLGTVISIQ